MDKTDQEIVADIRKQWHLEEVEEISVMAKDLKDPIKWKRCFYFKALIDRMDTNNVSWGISFSILFAAMSALMFLFLLGTRMYWYYVAITSKPSCGDCRWGWGTTEESKGLLFAGEDESSRWE